MLQLCKLGRMAYDQALSLQFDLLAQRQDDRIPDTLLVLEHQPVITLGTRGRPENIYRDLEMLEKEGVAVHRVGRGGDVTYHGPGQLILYPLVKLYQRQGGIRQFIQTIEETVITWLAEVYGLSATCGTGKMTGVWVDEAKIMAIGLAVKQGVTMHGFALNLTTDLTPFDWINPCGLARPVTSLHLLVDEPIDFAQVSHQLVMRIAKALDPSWQWIDRKGLEQETDLPAVEPEESDPVICPQTVTGE